MAGAKMVKTSIPGVYRRGPRYAFTWRDASGTQRWGSAASFEEAKGDKAAEEKKARDGQQHVPPHEQITVAAFAAEWFGCDLDREPGATAQDGRYRARRGIRQATADDYRRDLERHWLPDLGRVRLPQLTTPMIQKHLDKVAAREGDAYLRDSTLRRVTAPFTAMLACAVREGVIRSNPAREAEIPTRDRHMLPAEDEYDGGAIFKAYMHSEVVALLGVLGPRPQLHLLVRLLATTGLRISEALALEWTHLRLDGSKPCVRVRQSIVRARIGPPKSKHGRRDVPIPHATVIALREHHARSDPRHMFVFASSTGAPSRPENLRRDMVTLAEEAGVAWIGWHAFRHFYASKLLAEGRNIVQVSRAMGHHSPTLTLSVYAHVLDDGVGEALELDLTPAPAALEAAVEHVLRREEAA